VRHEEVAGDKIDLDVGSLTGGNGSSRYLGEGLPGSTPDAPCARLGAVNRGPSNWVGAGQDRSSDL